MIDSDQISSILRNFGEGKHRIDKKAFEQDWTNRSLSKKDLAEKYNLKTIHEVDKFASECNLSSRYSWEARFEKNKDKEVRKILNHVYNFNDIGISINKIEESGVGSRKKIIEMINSGYLVLGDSTLKNEKVIFLNSKLQPRFFSVDLRKLKQMYLNPEVTTNAISNRLGLGDITAVSRIANCIDLPIRDSYNDDQFSEKKNKFEKLWNDPLKTNEQIANELQISTPTLGIWRKKLKLLPRRFRQNKKINETFEEFLINLLETNNGAISLYDYQEKTNSIKYREIFSTKLYTTCYESEHLSIFRLPMGLISKEFKIPSDENPFRYSRPSKLSMLISDAYALFDSTNFSKSVSYFQEMEKECYARDGIKSEIPKLISQLQIIYFTKEYDSLLLKIAKIYSEITAINKIELCDALTEFTNYDNSRGAADATREIILNKIPILKEIMGDKEKLKIFQKEIKLTFRNNDKKSEFDQNNSIQNSFSHITSNISEFSLKEMLSEIKYFEEISENDNKFLFVVNNQRVSTVLLKSKELSSMLSKSVDHNQSPRDFLRKILNCVCYEDKDITFLCPHCHFILWNFYRDDKHPINRKDVDNFVQNLDFIIKCMCPLEDIIFEQITFSNKELEHSETISLLLQNKTVPSNYGFSTNQGNALAAKKYAQKINFQEIYEKYKDFWILISHLDDKRKNMLLDFFESQKPSTSLESTKSYLTQNYPIDKMNDLSTKHKKNIKYI